MSAEIERRAYSSILTTVHCRRSREWRGRRGDQGCHVFGGYTAKWMVFSSSLQLSPIHTPPHTAVRTEGKAKNIDCHSLFC